MLTSVFNVFVHYNVVEGRTYKDTLFFLDRYLIPYYNLHHIKHIEIVGNNNERNFMLWRFQHIWFNTWNKRTV